MHELIHGIHYSCRPEFDLKKIVTSKERLVIRTIVEGLATHLCEKTLNYPVDKYWYGFINSSLCHRWIENCKSKLSNDLELLRKMKTLENFETQLFSFFGLSPEEICDGRRGYYYGDQIAERFLKENSMQDAFNADLKKWLMYF